MNFCWQRKKKEEATPFFFFFFFNLKRINWKGNSGHQTNLFKRLNDIQFFENEPSGLASCLEKKNKNKK